MSHDFDLAIFSEHTSGFLQVTLQFYVSSDFFPPRVKKIVATNVGCCRLELDTCKQQNIIENVGKITVTNWPLDVVRRMHIYIHTLSLFFI